jgi:hypothetical protein
MELQVQLQEDGLLEVEEVRRWVVAAPVAEALAAPPPAPAILQHRIPAAEEGELALSDIEAELAHLV